MCTERVKKERNGKKGKSGRKWSENECEYICNKAYKSRLKRNNMKVELQEDKYLPVKNDYSMFMFDKSYFYILEWDTSAVAQW